MRTRSNMGAGLLLGVALLTAPDAPAVSYRFENLTPEAQSASIADQLSVEVTDAGGGKVQFLFRNAGSAPGSIFSVAFDDDGNHLSDMRMIPYPGVQFEPTRDGSSLVRMPAGFDHEFAANRNGGAANGVGPGELLGIQFNGNYETVLADLNAEILRIGLHVGGLPGGKSQKLLNVPLVPETIATIGGVALACLVVEALRRKLVRSRA